MPFYQDFNKKKMTRKDHLRADSKWEEEGTRYRRSTAQADQQKREQKENAFAHPGKPEGRGRGGNAPRPEQRYDRKPDQRTDRGPRPEQRYDRKPDQRPLLHKRAHSEKTASQEQAPGPLLFCVLPKAPEVPWSE